MSKKFTNTQCRYFAYELKALGVLEALMRWQDDLMGGHEFTVIMDHKALEYFKVKNHNSGRHLRLQAFFASFNCKIKYMEGHKNKVADTLSQHYDLSMDKDLHFDNYMSADIHLDKNAEDIIPDRVKEYVELLLSSTLSENSEKKRLAAICVSNTLEGTLGGEHPKPGRDHTSRGKSSKTIQRKRPHRGNPIWLQVRPDLMGNPRKSQKLQKLLHKRRANNPTWRRRSNPNSSSKRELQKEVHLRNNPQKHS
jgi:hypothetical protein